MRCRCWRCCARRESRLYGPRTRADLRLTAVAGLFFAIDLIVWARAIEDVGAGLATVLGNLQVVLVGVLAWAFLRERPERRMFVATPIVLIGVILISGVVGSGTYGRDPARGVVYGLLTAIAYAGFILCLRHGNNDLRRPAGPLFEATATAAVFALVLGAALGDLHVVPSWPEHGWLLLLALSSQVMGWLLISISLPRLPAAVTSVTLTTQPVGSVLLAVADLQRVAVRVPVHRRGGGAGRRAGGELSSPSCRCHIFRGEPMTVSGGNGGRSRNLILAAMIFAVSMTFIDQTIVSIAAPEIQRELGLSSTGVQWAINAYLLSLAALFAFGGRLADTVGHRRMVTLGVIVFAGASAMCGLTPKGSLAEAWIVTFRVVQGAGGAIMFPAALAIVVQTFPLRERGKALALFFGIAGGLTAIGPILGGYLTQWTWRAIFWVNIPVAIVALVLIAVSKPSTEYRPARIDYRGLVLIASGVALSVFGFQQSSIWGWGNPATWACIVVGAALLVAFYFVEKRTAVAADPGEDLQDPGLPGREPGARHRHAGVRPGLLLRQRVRADRAREDRVAGRPLPPLLLPRVRRRGPDRRAGCSTGAAPSARWWSAARSPPWDSGSGPGRSPTSTSARRSGRSSSPEPAWA